jgi:hypothetical protein
MAAEANVDVPSFEPRKEMKDQNGYLIQSLRLASGEVAYPATLQIVPERLF